MHTLEEKLLKIQCQIEVFNAKLHLMQVEMIKINNMCKTIQWTFLAKKKDDEDDDFSVYATSWDK